MLGKRKRVLVGVLAVFLLVLAGTEKVDAVTNLDTVLVGSWGKSHRSAQSMAYDSDKGRLVVADVTAPGKRAGGLAAAMSGQATMHLISPDGKSLGNCSSRPSIGHANGMTYNSKKKQFVVAVYEKAVYLDSETCAVVGEKYGPSISSLGYSAERDMYYGSRGSTARVFTSEFSQKSSFGVQDPTSGNQDGDARGQYYFKMSSVNVPNTIDKHDVDQGGKRVGEFRVPSPSCELESMVIVNDIPYLLYNSCGNGWAIYKLTPDSAKKLLEGVDLSGENNSGRTAVSTISPSDVKKYKDKLKLKARKKAKDRTKKKATLPTKRNTAMCTSILPDAWCDDANAVNKLLNLGLYVLTAGFGVLGMGGIVWFGAMIVTAGDSVDRTRLGRKRIIEIILGMILWGMLFAIARFILIGKIV